MPLLCPPTESIAPHEGVFVVSLMCCFSLFPASWCVSLCCCFLLLCCWNGGANAQSVEDIIAERITVNTSFIDLILDFTNAADFSGADHTQWRFLRKLCGLTSVTSDYYGEVAGLARWSAPTLAGRRTSSAVSAPLCAIAPGGRGALPLNETTARALPFVSVQLGAQGYPVLRYDDASYLVTLRFFGTRFGRTTFLDRINRGERPRMFSLGVSVAFLVPQYDLINAAAALEDAAVLSSASFSWVWYALLVVFILLVAGIGVSFFRMTRSTQDDGLNKRARDIEDDDDLVAHMFPDDRTAAPRNTAESGGGGNSATGEHDAEDAEMGEAVEMTRVASAIVADPRAFTGDTTAVVSAPPAAGGEGAPARPSRGGPRIGASGSRWTVDRLTMALETQPQLRLPPRSEPLAWMEAPAATSVSAAAGTAVAASGGGIALADLVALPPVDASDFGMQGTVEGGTTALPPDAAVVALAEAKRRSEQTKRIPLGLSARRLAAVASMAAVAREVAASPTAPPRRSRIALTRLVLTAQGFKPSASQTSNQGAASATGVGGSVVGAGPAASATPMPHPWLSRARRASFISLGAGTGNTTEAGGHPNTAAVSARSEGNVPRVGQVLQAPEVDLSDFADDLL